MHDPISIILCVAGVITCIVGVSTFVSAQITKAKEDGVLMAKVDHLVKSLEELKSDTKEKYNSMDTTLDKCVRDNTDMKRRIENLEREVFKKNG